MHRSTPIDPLRTWLGSLLLALATLLAGCATALPKVDREAITTEALPADANTRLGRIVAASTPAGEHSGFRLLPLGPYSFDTRLALAEAAQHSLDVQYYHLEGDISGRTLLRALRDAAARGVRVRLLIDDLYTGGHDELFLGLGAHPNLQVRVFNPFCCARGSGQAPRFLASVGEWKRLNHRMHNKMFVADGASAVIGGRNIADEYFLRGVQGNFIDMDAFVVGKLVEPLAALFDRYWNSEPVFPYASVAKTALSQEALRAYFERETSSANTPAAPKLPPTDILGYGPLREELADGRVGLIWGEAYAFADHPDKPFDGEAGGDLLETSVTYNIIEPLMKAKREVLISSPYFVPGERGMKLLRELRARGVKVTVMTNSLGSTDEPVVHVGYKKYRPELLRLGIDLYEVSTSRVQRNRRLFHFGESLGRLHAKLMVIDREVVFIGSMNFDPRSATINTELGAIVSSSQLAKEMARAIDLDRLQSAYRVRFGPNGTLQWLGFDDDGAEQVLNEEPDTSAWIRFKVWLLAPLVPESLL